MSNTFKDLRKKIDGAQESKILLWNEHVESFRAALEKMKEDLYDGVGEVKLDNYLSDYDLNPQGFIISRMNIAFTYGTHNYIGFSMYEGPGVLVFFTFAISTTEFRYINFSVGHRHRYDSLAQECHVGITEMQMLGMLNRTGFEASPQQLEGIIQIQPDVYLSVMLEEFRTHTGRLP
jgi:hypothetical protein